MSDVITPLETAIAARIKTVLPDAEIVCAVAEADLAALRLTKTLVDVVFDADTFARSEEMGGPVTQAELFRWLVYVEVPVGGDRITGRAEAYAALAAIRSALAPSAGFKPDAYSSSMEVESIDFLGLTASGRLYCMSFVHDRWEG